MNARARLVAALAGVAALTMGALLPIGPSGAALAGSTFESSDGNLTHAAGVDWDNAGISCVATVVGCAIDQQTGTNDDSFGSGPNNKEDGDPPPVTTGSIPNNKSDLTRFYVTSRRESNKNFLFLAWERVQDPNGTTNMDFEFNQSRTKSANGVTPVRTAGDLLINYDLSNGGTNPTLGYRRWITEDTANGPAASVCDSAKTFPCWDKVHALTGNFEGAINPGTVTDPILIDDQPGPRSLSARTFGEAGVNLTDSGILPAGTCQTFGSAFLKSRSADTFTSSLKDYIAPIDITITNCGSVSIHKQDDTGAALSDVTFTLYTNNAPTAGPRGVEDTATTHTCTTDANGDCTILNVPYGEYWVVEGTPPSGYDGAADQALSLSANSPVPVPFTFVNPRKPASVKLHKQDDTGAALANATFTLYTNAAPTAGPRGAEDTATSFSCTTDANGNCTISNVLPAGNYWVVETTVPSGYSAAADRAITLSLGQSLDISATPFVDNRLFKVVTLVCRESDGALVSAKVSYDGAALPGSPNSATVGGDITTTVQSAVCGMTGTAVHGGVPAGSHSSSISIP